MTNPLIQRILKASGVDNLLEILGEQLAPTDLQSLMLEVYRVRAAHQTPARVLDQYRHNRFVRPSNADPLRMLEFDRLAFSLAAPPFEPIELSPLAPLGVVSAMAPVDQNCTVATSRNTETMSDSTNVMALECAVRRSKFLATSQNDPEWVRLCASHRLVRAQNFNRPGVLAHFRLFALCTAGRDEGGYQFECAALVEQIGFYLQLLEALRHAGYTISQPHAGVTDFSRNVDPLLLQSAVIEPLATRFPGSSIALDSERAAGQGYYPGLCFDISARDDLGTQYNLADGGFTGWTQLLLNNKKERLLISGIGTERVCSLFHPPAQIDFIKS